MFSTPERIEAKIGKHGTPRRNFLRELVNEFKETVSIEYKEQILANLANFAYDPVNFGFLTELNVDKLFLDCLTQEAVNTDKLREFAVKGILNLCPDDFLRNRILTRGGMELVKEAVGSSEPETVLSAIAVLNEFAVHDLQESDRASLLNPVFVERVLKLKTHPNPLITKLAQVFVEDHCSQALIRAAVELRNVASGSS
ncbi:unnamed protein product [Notodromas monacha]|uniref:Armadillo repeat-containing protein 7 n=1 Tax=Notodromas monacha TaxID=399045 RepID=A0A7R9BUX8_9CRUS|nr:unnamed protein product [Notodromas monacha]CAG0920678.1 unnamed protein product [Notodromas monacha]